ncbi:MAG TPA: glycerol kinase GlpK [Actinomycetota bacterium]|nr:glycerol kinase GlpK [Actinomycetota bacterium]
MSAVLAIDAGTTGMRAMVVDPDAGVLSRGYREFPQSFPRPGWVEHDPEDWWNALLAATDEALASAAVASADLAAIGVTNQRETTVLWNRATLKAVHPAIVWQDRRTAPLCRTLSEEGWETRIRERTGLVVDPYFSATKIAWLLDNVAGGRERARAGALAFGTVDSYLLARLTGGAVHATDDTNASRTMLFDIHRRAWDEELCERLDIPASLLPDVRPSCGRFGVTDPDAFLGARIPISGIAGDQQASLFGHGCTLPGQTKNTYGTGSFLLMHTGGTPVTSPGGLLTTMAASTDGRPAYALEGAIFVSGAAIQWLRDGLGIIDAASEVGPLAASAPDTGGVVFVPALAGLGAPWWDPEARGTIIGITRGTNRAHLARATVEALAYQTRDVVDLMRRDSGLDLPELRVDGGASAMDLLLQLQADALNVPVVRPPILETTAIGAARLAGIAEGVWNETAFTHVGEGAARFQPADTAAADAGYARWRRAVERSLKWADEETTTP